MADNEFRKEITAGALPSQQTNVFIDGVSYKNDLILGGVVGQDSSRGSPFPQNAVQEFQVLTQNFKAEYEKAGSAIITAVTRSGGNTYHGDIFNFYQDKSLAENEEIRNVDGTVQIVEPPSPPTSAGSGARRSAARSSATGCSSSDRTRKTVRTAPVPSGSAPQRERRRRS